MHSFSKMKSLFLISFLFCYISGPKMPKKLGGLSAVVLNGDLYAIGGRDENDYPQAAIHCLSCSSGNCAWTTMDQELTVARYFHIAMAVPNDLCIGPTLL